MSFPLCRMSSQHQFWVPIDVDEEVENKELLAESRSRFISFPGSFIPVKHYCSAPLDNGKLCERQDRLKVQGATQRDLPDIYVLHYSQCVCLSCDFVLQCPFHGLIIPRDQEGRPCREEDRLREEREKRRKQEEQPGEE